MSFIEIAGVITGIISVWLLIRLNVWAWPVGIINVTIYVYIFYGERLYLDMALQVFYIIIQIYGWYNWARGKNEEGALRVSRLTFKEAAFWILGSAATVPLLWTLTKTYTDDSLPFLDSVTTTLSLVAQWLLTYKKWENWTLWIIADLIYVPMYIYKNLYLTSFLYFIFLILAIAGWREWKKNLYKNRLTQVHD